MFSEPALPPLRAQGSMIRLQRACSYLIAVLTAGCFSDLHTFTKLCCLHLSLFFQRCCEDRFMLKVLVICVRNVSEYYYWLQ